MSLSAKHKRIIHPDVTPARWLACYNDLHGLAHNNPDWKITNYQQKNPDNKPPYEQWDLQIAKQCTLTMSYDREKNIISLACNKDSLEQSELQHLNSILLALKRCNPLRSHHIEGSPAFVQQSYKLAMEQWKQHELEPTFTWNNDHSLKALLNKIREQRLRQIEEEQEQARLQAEHHIELSKEILENNNQNQHTKSNIPKLIPPTSTA